MMSSLFSENPIVALDLEPLEPSEELVVEQVASANLPTKYGQFQIVAFRNNRDFQDHVALVRGSIDGAEELPTRLHSECLTGDAFGSLKCDCGEQLERALEELAASDQGILLYMRQEGRGIGLANKIRAYALQDQGLDTVEANLHLGFDDDMRDYDVAARMLEILGVKSIQLITNNPRKVRGLRHNGIEIVKRLPLKVLPNPHNVHYLETKKKKSGHLL